VEDKAQDFTKGRILHRPKINYFVATVNVLLPLAFAVVVGKWSFWVGLFLFAVYAFVRAKAILIWLVRLYQSYAPDDVRLACLFVPSCSEHMILSIKKFGAFKGSKKGIMRLKRCKAPSQGEDYP